MLSQERKDSCKEDQTIVNHFHGVSSSSESVESMDTTAPGAQWRLCSDILDFHVFPYSEKTGDNIKSWFLQVLIQNNIKHSMASSHLMEPSMFNVDWV